MATLAKSLIEGSQLTTSAAVYYTTPASATAIIKNLTLTNTSAGAVTYIVYLKQDGAGAPAAKDQIVAGTLSPTGVAGSTVVIGSATHALKAGGTIQALSNTATAVTIKATGLEQY